MLKPYIDSYLKKRGVLDIFKATTQPDETVNSHMLQGSKSSIIFQKRRTQKMRQLVQANILNQNSEKIKQLLPLGEISQGEQQVNELEESNLTIPVSLPRYQTTNNGVSGQEMFQKQQSNLLQNLFNEKLQSKSQAKKKILEGTDSMQNNLLKENRSQKRRTQNNSLYTSQLKALELIKNKEKDKERLSLEKLSTKDLDIVRNMQRELNELRRNYQKITDDFLEQIEERYIVFVEDGTDMRELKLGLSEGTEVVKQLPQKSKYEQICWKKMPKQVKINVNKYLAKYNFEIAKKIKGFYYIEPKAPKKQTIFNQTALKEVLQECSNVLTKGKRVFNTLMMIDGTIITDLSQIPEDCKMLLVSNVDSESNNNNDFNNTTQINTERSRSNNLENQIIYKGLKGNVYNFNNEQEQRKFQSKRIKRDINKSKEEWFYHNLNHWAVQTPLIQDLHRKKDLELHNRRDYSENITSTQRTNNILKQEMSQIGENASHDVYSRAEMGTAKSYLMRKDRQGGRQNFNQYLDNLYQQSQNDIYSDRYLTEKQQLYSQQYPHKQQNISLHSQGYQIGGESKNNEMEKMEKFFKFKDPSFNKTILRKDSIKKNKFLSNSSNVPFEINNFNKSEMQDQSSPNFKSFITEAKGLNQPPPVIGARKASNRKGLNFQDQAMKTAAFGQMKMLDPDFAQTQQLLVEDRVSHHIATPSFSQIQSQLGNNKNNRKLKQMLRSNNKSNANEEDLIKSLKNNNTTTSTSNHQKKKSSFQMNQQKSIMPYEEIEMWARKYDLQWKEIYELDSEFQSLLKIEQQDKDSSIQKVLKEKFIVQDLQQNNNEGMIPESINKAQQKIGDNDVGITLKTFLEYSKILNGKTQEFTQHIIQAFGIDEGNKNSKITWELFLQLKCFMQFFTLGTEELKKIWMKILDPHGIRHLAKLKVASFLEGLARGSTTGEQTIVSKQYSAGIMKLLELEGCISENGQDVLMERVEECLNNDIFDVELFNQVLKLECMYFVESKNHYIDEFI